MEFARRSTRRAACSIAAVCACSLTLVATADPPAFESRELAESIYLMRPAGGRSDLANSLLVVRHDGLLVVDAQATPEAARELLAAIAAVSRAPIRYLVLSHAHAEAAGGASAFPESTLVIASTRARDALGDPEWDFAAELDGGMTGADARKPVLVLQARTELDDPQNRIEIFPLGHAHTNTDLFVVVPRANLIYAGAVLFDRQPYARDADVGGWLAALNYLTKLRPAIVVPLHGEPTDVSGVRKARESLAWLRGRVELGFIDGIAPERIPDRVLADEEFDDYFGANVSSSVARGLIEQAVAEAIEQRRKRGIM
ncbi:MAG TPA: MBL fold metallo-hydrolase [Candidatus Polarisedimenticolaceae bacterium]|nr:MBL fold metallo-hydrolase [Candidatus Polarisedimenticolaceae bacterium]